jgi:pantoate--beta-alanine ligase
MDIIATIPELRNRLKRAGRIAFVPTMGNLHAGHIALVETARRQADCVVASIFVNPLQFGANEDLASYPRTLQADCEKLAGAGCDVVFTPSESVLYPEPQTLFVEPPPIAAELCGSHRPGHFRGVCTVVAKLFNIVQPDVAIFGKKDYQQLFILRAMARQLDMPVEMLAGETIREQDGLAMSSRNGYLKPAERLEAPRLYRALQQVTQSVQGGRHDLPAIETQTGQYLTQLGWIVDYVAVRSADTLMPPQDGEKRLVALGAARLGKTRLIDNIEFAL